MTLETGDGTLPPSETHKKRAKDCDCYHFATNGPNGLASDSSASSEFMGVARVAQTAGHGRRKCYLPEESLSPADVRRTWRASIHSAWIPKLFSRAAMMASI